MNKKTIYIIVAVLVIVIVVAGAGILLMNNGGNGGETTPTVSVKDATSLQYSANVTSQGTTITYNFAGKDLGTTNMTLRIDLLGGASGNYSYILSASEEKSWLSINGGTWTEGNFTADWASMGSMWSENADALANWTGTGDYSFTAKNGDSIKIFDIAVNPTIADSLFATS